MQLDPALLLGPLGLTVGLVLAVVALWRAHAAADADVRAQRDKALEGWRTSVDNVGHLADALEQDARDRAARTRRT